MGKIARMVSDTSLTESSIPPICAKMAFEIHRSLDCTMNYKQYNEGEWMLNRLKKQT